MFLVKKIFGSNRLSSTKGAKNENAPGSKSRDDKCPYCSAVLEKKPARKTKCPHCGNYIFVRKGHLLTEDQMTIEEWVNRLAEFGVTKEVFSRHRKQLSEQFGSQPSVNDIIWRVLNSLAASTTDHSQAKLVYHEMAYLVRGEGNDPKPYLAEAAKHELLDLKKSGVISRVRVQTANDSFVCAQCRALAEKVFTVEQALNDMPIPNACENENGCRCWYSSVVDF